MASRSGCVPLFFAEAPQRTGMIFPFRVAFLMISNIRYRTMKRIQPRHSLLFLFILAGFVGFGSMYPRQTIPVLTVFYMFSPLIIRFYNRMEQRKIAQDSKTVTPESGGESDGG